MKNKKLIIGILAIGSIIIITAVVFAQGGYGRYMGRFAGQMMGQGCGYGGQMMKQGCGYGGQMMGQGHGGHMMKGGTGHGGLMRGHGGWQDMSDEEATKIEEARERFFDETRELRQKMKEQHAVMRSEMIKENPDQATLIKLQKELSELKADFGQKALIHRLEMRKLLPEKFEGRKFGHRGPQGPGYCW